MRKFFALLLVLAALSLSPWVAPGSPPLGIPVTHKPTPTPTPKPKPKPKVTPAVSPTPAPTPETSSTPAPDASPAASPDAPQAETPKPRHRARKSPSPSPAESPTPTPKPRKASLFHRIFIGTPATPVPEKPTPTPVAKPKVYRKKPLITVTPPPETSPAKVAPAPRIPALKANYKPTPLQTVTKPASALAVEKSTPAPAPAEDNTGEKAASMTSDVPFVPTPTPAAENAQPPISPEDEEAKDKARYHEIKAQALEDKEIKSLQEKADNATSPEDQRAAATEYNKALFKKLRTLDPSISDYIDRMEKATMKRIDRGAPQ